MVWQSEAARSSDTDLVEFRQFSRELITAFVDYQAESCETALQNLAPDVAAQFVDVLVSNNCRLAGRLYDLVSEHPDFEVLNEQVLYPFYFRFVPNALAERKRDPEIQFRIDRLNREIVEAIQRSRRALVVTTDIRGSVAIRMSVCSTRIKEEDIDATFETIARWGRALALSSDTLNQLEKEEMPCSSEPYSLPTEV